MLSIEMKILKTFFFLLNSNTTLNTFKKYIQTGILDIVLAYFYSPKKIIFFLDNIFIKTLGLYIQH